MSEEANRARPRRTKLIVAAFLETEAGVFPVQIRNISRGGALAVGSVPARSGEKIQLRRGSLLVAGSVAWREGNKVGLVFDEAYEAHNWLPALTENSEEGADTNNALEATQMEELTDAVVVERISQELQLISRTVEQVADKLASDPLSARRYAAQIQGLVHASDVVLVLSGLVVSKSLPDDAWNVKIESLRRRLVRD